MINGIAIAFPAVALSFVILRLYARCLITRAFGVDDGSRLFCVLQSSN